MLATTTGVDRGNLDGSTPGPIIEPRSIPPMRMPSSIKGLKWQAGHVSWKWDRSPRVCCCGSPGAVRHDPLIIDLQLEGEGARSE